MNAPIIAEVTAATGDTDPDRQPGAAADERDPRAAEVRPAPSSASPGRLNRAMTTPAGRSICGTDETSGGGTTEAITTSAPKIAAAANAPRRAARIPASRRPVGSGRQFGSHGPIIEVAAEAPPRARRRA